MTPDDIVNRLRDIRDIDPVSAWPPGPGWWAVALVVILLLVLVGLGPFRPKGKAARQRPP